jgi:hypothetical protein
MVVLLYLASSNPKSLPGDFEREAAEKLSTGRGVVMALREKCGFEVKTGNSYVPASSLKRGFMPR